MDYERERREEEEAKSRIETAKDKLYAPDAPLITHRRSAQDNYQLDGEEVITPRQQWDPQVRKDFKDNRLGEKVGKVFKKILVGAIIFFILSVIGAIFFYFYGNNIISSRNITIDINAPASVPSSDTFTYDISIQNGNNADLIDSDIVIDYPDGARSVEDNTQPLVSEKIDVGTLKKGEILKKTVSARLFGKENTTKTIKVTYEYNIANSNGHFSKDKSFDVVLRLAPVVLSIDALKEVNNNQEISLTANIISNSNNPLKNIALDVTYPFGFVYKESNLEVETGSRGQFPIGDLMPNETKKVIITGTITGQSADDKVFKFNVGTADQSAPEEVTTSLATYDHNLTIRNDFLATSVVIDNSTNGQALGYPVRGVLSWKNTLSVPLTDVQFSMKIAGALVDQQNISVDQGFYDSGRSVITWNKGTADNLKEIPPGASGQFGFSIPLLSYERAANTKVINPKVDLSLDVNARRLSDNNVAENITSSFTKQIPVVTSVAFTSKSLRSSGALKNTGPVPPKAEQKSTYTIVLSLTNSVNKMTDGVVTATLPPYVTYENEISPQSEQVSWNDNTRQITWKVGTIDAYTGYGTSPKTLSFKVGIIPSKSQVGQAPELVRNISFKGYDDFAGISVTKTASAVTTSAQDLSSGSNNGQVVQ